MTPASPAEVQEQLRVRRGRGSPLPDGVRQHMELRFDADFSGVRIHTDDPAIQLTRLLKANAFTQGNEIFFNQGRFAPGSREGQHLLAHELTHTIQQGAAGARQIQPQAEPSAVQRQEDDEATILIRPELLAAIKLARGEIGKVNAKQTNTDNTRLGWERLVEYFFTAFGEKEVVHPDVIKFIQQTKDSKGSKKDAMPSWCGIFVWWSYKKAGIPIPSWKLGVSIMGWVTPRKSGELPRKGDIAYRDQPFQHFAMVTGVESPESAAGKDFKSILVATINGNTSGNDNIGGQVEEKWEPISRWSGFFDPVAMLDMPPAPLVKTGVEPESSAATGAGEEAAAAAEEATVETPPTDVCHLEEAITSEPEVPGAGEADVAVEQPEPPPAVEAEVEVELPPAPALPAAEEVAKVEPLPLEGSSDEAMAGFTEASPSQMATTQPGLGEALDGKINQEKQDEVDNAPVLVAQTSGTVAEGLTPPDQIPVPGETPIGDGVTGAEPGDLTAKPHENFGAAPSNEANEKELDKQEEGGFLSWLRDNIKGFLGQIRTKDPGLDTKAGERPKMQLEGEADPGRMAQQREEAKTQIVGQRDAAKRKEEGEKEAADKKKELEKDQEKDSWWDRAAGFIKKAVKVLTETIDTIFTALREAVKTIIEKAKNAAIGLINAARDWVVDKLNKFRDWAKEQVNTYLKDRFPELAARINNGIDAVVDTAIKGVNDVANAAIAGVEALAKGLAAALDKVLAVFPTALKAAVQIAGAVLTGDFAEALRIAIRAACEIAGIDPQPIFDFIDRAAAQITNILKHPMEFFNNVMAAVGAGVRSFVTNIKRHLIGGLIGWLTGALSEVAITLPENFDVQGVFSLVMQILGLTYENIKAKVIKRFPPAATVFAVVEKGFTIVKRLVTEGPMALWEEAKAALSNLKEIVLDGIRGFVITTVIKEAITWLLGLLNPASALVKILKLIFDFVMFLVERFEQIKDFVMSVYNAVTAIASGALGQAQAAVEDAMARSLPVAIGLLASLAGLGGIGKTVKGIIGNVAKPVHKVVDKVIAKIIKFVKKLLKKGKAAAKKVKEKLVQWWKSRKSFNMTPLSRTGNKEHESQFESIVKAATSSGAIMEYNVIRKYASRGDKASLKQEIEKMHAANKAADIGRVIDAEDHVPGGLTCEMFRLEKSGTDTFKRTSTQRNWTVLNPVERNANSYFLTGVSKVFPININAASEELLNQIPGITPQQEKDIYLTMKDRDKPFGVYKVLAEEVKSLDLSTLTKWNSDGYIVLG